MKAIIILLMCLVYTAKHELIKDIVIISHEAISLPSIHFCNLCSIPNTATSLSTKCGRWKWNCKSLLPFHQLTPTPLQCHFPPAPCCLSESGFWTRGYRIKPFLPVRNRGSLTSLPLGGVLSYRDRWALDAPVVRPGLAEGSFSPGRSQTTVSLGSLWERWTAASEEESRAVTGCLSPKRMEGERRVTAEGLRPH